MRARDLRRLAEVSAAAKMDLESGTATLYSDGERTRSWYQSPYAACGIVIAENIPGLDVSVGAAEFRAIAELYDEDDILTVVPDESKHALRISSSRRKMDLRYEGYPDHEAYDLLVNDFSSLWDVDAAEFAREIRTAVQYCAVQMSVPILTGIRLRAKGGQMGIESMNGASLLSQATIATSPYDGDTKIVTPATNIADALAALRPEGRLYFGTKGRALIMRGGDSVFKIPTLPGEWPKFSQKTRELPYPEVVKLPIDTVRALAGAVRIYKAPADISLRPGDKPSTVLLETKAVEAGQFVEEVDGAITRQYTFDVSDLEVVSRTIGDMMTMEIGDVMARVTGGERSTYLLQRLVNA